MSTDGARPAGWRHAVALGCALHAHVPRVRRSAKAHAALPHGMAAIQYIDAVCVRCGGAAVWRCGGAAVWRCGGAAVRRCALRSPTVTHLHTNHARRRQGLRNRRVERLHAATPWNDERAEGCQPVMKNVGTAEKRANVGASSANE